MMLARALLVSLALAALPAIASAQNDGSPDPRPPAGALAPGQAAPLLGVSPRDSALDARTRALASELRCPVCQGESLQDSGSELAREMRSLIAEQLRSGKSPAQVRAYFVSKYGEWILLQPEAHGFTLAVYLLPILVLLAGAVVVFLAARRWTGRPGPVGVESAAEAEADEPRVEAPEAHS